MKRTIMTLILYIAICTPGGELRASAAEVAPSGETCDPRAVASLQIERDEWKKRYEETSKSNDAMSERIVALIRELQKVSSIVTDPEIQKVNSSFYRRWAEHNLLVFQMTLIESTVLLIVVLAVVGSGLYFSYMQLRTALYADTISRVNSPSHDSATNLELSVSGVKITSSVAGTIILALSLAFFYLYLKEVYPIKIYSSIPGSSASSQ